LLAVLAHPDDETLGVGGLLADCASRGIETFLVTATRGQAGRYRGKREGEGPGHPGKAALARLREKELRAAATVLGVREVTVLDYEDGRLDQADPKEASARIAAEIRRIRPHVAVTFSPDGGYGHPDHIAISQFAGAAIVAAASEEDPANARHAVSKFYFMASSERNWVIYQETFKQLTSMVDGIERSARPWPEWAITTELDTAAHVDTVWKAAFCHESQVAGYDQLRSTAPERSRELWGRQTFYRVFSTVNGGRRRETDLFEGIDP
jgi:LmbE family N-acetylglucosaminyl deacetylase